MGKQLTELFFKVGKMTLLLHDANSYKAVKKKKKKKRTKNRRGTTNKHQPFSLSQNWKKLEL
jgi:hypothetical protein